MPASPLVSALIGSGGGQESALLGMDPAILQAQPDLNLAQALLKSGTDLSPVGHPLAALARVAQTAVGRDLQQGAISELSRAYAHSAESAAATLPEGHPLKAALLSADPSVRMQALGQYGKVMTLLSEPQRLGEGQQVFPGAYGTQPGAANTLPISPQGKIIADQARLSGVPGAGTALGRVLTKEGVTAEGVPYPPTGFVPSGPPRMGTPAPSGAGIVPSRPVATTNVRPGASFDERYSAGALSGLPEAIANAAAFKAAAVSKAETPALVERAGALESAKNPALIARAGGEAAAKAPYEAGGEITVQTPAGPQTIPATAATRATIQPGGRTSVPLATLGEKKGAESLAGTASEGIGKQITEVIEAGGKVARDKLNALDAMETAVRNSGPGMITGPKAELALKTKEFLNGIGLNANWVTKDLPESEIISKMNAQLASASAKAMTGRPTQFEFNSWMRNNPGLLTSKEGTLALADILRQQTNQDITLGQKALNKENWNKWGDVVSQHYQDTPLRNPLTGKLMRDEIAGAAAAKGAPPPAAVARLRANPAEAAMFDKTFGAGAAAKVLGTK